MKKSIKLFIIPMALMLSSQLIGCNVAKKEIALITDVGDIDDGSFNQGSWEAIKDYCTHDKPGKTYDYYRPFADSEFARDSAIKQAVYKGAKVIVCPGFKFAGAVNRAQYAYHSKDKTKDVKFILLDSATNDDMLSNCVCVGYKCEYSGYLSGYSIMKDYLTYDLKIEKKVRNDYSFGYCGGMASDGVLQFGFGYIQGIIKATVDFFKENNLDISNYPKLTFRHNYAGVFAQSDQAAMNMKSWYVSGVKCIFPCGGKLYQSITEAAKDYNKKYGYYDDLSKDHSGELFSYNPDRDAARWVGVDSDQYTGLKDKHDKNSIYTSALKGLKTTIKTALKYYDEDLWGEEEKDLIGGAYDPSKTFIPTFTKTFDKEGKETASAEKNAEDYRTNTNKLSMSNYFESKSVPNGDGTYKIQVKKDSSSEFEDYKAQSSKQWVLGLKSKFGKVDKEVKPEELDYVGIPDNDADKAYDTSKGDDGLMRGFRYFTYGNYKTAKDNSSNSYVYGGDGTDLYFKDGGNNYIAVNTITDKDSPYYVAKGDPSFMGYKEKPKVSSKSFYIKDDGEYETYNKKCFSDYPEDKILVFMQS